MEAVCVVTCAALAWGMAFALLGQETRHVEGAGARLAESLWRRAVVPLSEGALARRLLGADMWRRSCTVVVRRARERGVIADEAEASACALLSCPLVLVVGAAASRSPVGGASLLAAALAGFLSLGGVDERRRRRALAEEMPGVFRTLAVALASGQTLSQAIEYVGSHGHGPAAEGFARTSLRMRCGTSAEEALALMAGELDAPGVGLLVCALTISQRTGSPLRGLFQRSAQLVERQQEFERTLSVRTAQVRLSVRVVCLLPLLMVGLLSLISVDFQRGLATTAGTLCVVVALGLDAVALLIIRRLMRGVL